MWRPDVLFSNIKYNDIYFVTDGGWHFSNIRKPDDLEKKLSNFLHYVDFKESGLSLKDLTKLMYEKKVMYNHKTDKKKANWGDGERLIRVSMNEIPKYINENYEKYKLWLEI